MLNIITNIIFPKECPFCQKLIGSKQVVCQNCEKVLPIINENKCEKCGRPIDSDRKIKCDDCQKKSHSYNKGVCVLEYNKLVSKSIYRFKYKNAREYGKTYALIAYEQYGEWIKSIGVQCIVPVPIHRLKKRARGFNQASEVGRELARLCGIAYEEQMLTRRKNTIPQKGLSNTQREVNLKNAFGVDLNKAGKYKRILLIDDIYTTGSTIDGCAKLLRKTGIKEVYFLCVAAKKETE